MLVVGLCGGIGAGKTTVAGLLAEWGAVVVDVDGIGRQVLGRDEVRDAVAAEFGTRVLAADGAMDRVALARVVFADHERLRALEAISHPAINREVAVRLDDISSASPDAVVVLDMARDRMARQASDKERRAAADHVVVNDSDLTALTAQVDNLWAALTG